MSHASSAAGTWSPLIRAALIVADLERSQRFYRELCGLDEVHACGDTRSDTIATLLGAPPGSRTRFAVLKRPGPGFGMLGLFELSEPVPLQMRHRTQREAVFADPDGVKLNVIERDPHEAHALHGPGLVL